VIYSDGRGGVLNVLFAERSGIGFSWIICDNRIMNAECQCLAFLGNDVDESGKIVKPSVEFGALGIDPFPRKL